MFCSHCGKEIVDEAVVCVGCGRPVTPLKQAAASVPVQSVVSLGAKAVRDTARAFLAGGILGIIGGLISVSVGWVFGIFSIVVGIIELVNAGQYWSTPPKSTKNPTFLPILEMISAFGGSFWSLFIGIANNRRLKSPEVKEYFLALESGQPLNLAAVGSPAIASALVVVNQKKCQSCGNSIPLEAKICQYCRQEFSDDEIATAQNQIQVDLAQKQAAAAEKKQLTQKQTLMVIGGILAGVGLIFLLLFLLVMFAPTTDSAGRQAFAFAIFACPAPLLLIGGGLFTWGFYALRKIKEEKAQS